MKLSNLFALLLIHLHFGMAEYSLANEVKILGSDNQTKLIYKSSHAILIGAINYHARESWNRLPKIDDEFSAIRKALIKKGFSVRVILDADEKKFRSNIDQFIDDFGYDQNNRLLFFFSGHGWSIGNKGYLVPIDAPDPNIDKKNFLRKAIPMSDIMAWARRIQAKHAIFLFDSCFSGTLFTSRARRPTPKYIENSTAKPTRQFITAGSEDEEVPSESVFAPLFVQGIEGEADANKDGYVTGAELGIFLMHTVPELDKGETQPQYGKIRDVEFRSGDFVFRSDLTKSRHANREVSKNANQPQSRKDIVWRMQLSWGDDEIYSKVLSKFKLGLLQIKIDLLPSGAIVKPFQVPAAIEDGVLSAGFVVPSLHPAWWSKTKPRAGQTAKKMQCGNTQKKQKVWLMINKRQWARLSSMQASGPTR